MTVLALGLLGGASSRGQVDGPAMAAAPMPDLTGVEVLTHRVTEDLYVLEATGDVAGNVAVLKGPDGYLLVDAQFAPLAERLRAALDALGPGGIRYVVATHYHADHSHGIAALAPEAVVVAHPATLRRMVEAGRSHAETLAVEDELELQWGAHQVRIRHLPAGHTDGDLVVIFPRAKAAHLGDLWNSGPNYPTVDLDTGARVAGMLRNVTELIRTLPPETRLVPGHYGIAGIDGLEVTRRMIEESLDLVGGMIEDGMDLEATKRKGMPERYAEWGQNFTKPEDWIENVYRDLKRREPSH